MSERFVVVPVDGGGVVEGQGEHSEVVVHDPAADSCLGEQGEGAGDDTVSEPQDPDAVVPILEYSREPNKYGKTAIRFTHGVPVLIITYLPG